MDHEIRERNAAVVLLELGKLPDVAAVVKAAVLAERERCARICDEEAARHGTSGFALAAGAAAENCAQDIRDQAP